MVDLQGDEARAGRPEAAAVPVEGARVGVEPDVQPGAADRRACSAATAWVPITLSSALTWFSRSSASATLASCSATASVACTWAG